MSFLQNVHLAEWILNICVHSLSILLIGWFFVQVFKRKTAPLRSGIGLITMLTLVLLPLVSISLSSLEYKTLPIRIISSNPAEPNTGIERTHSIQNSIKTPSRNGILQRITGSGPFMIKFINLFGIIWGLGTILFFFRFIGGAFSLRRLKKGRIAVSEQRSKKILKEVEMTFAKSLRAQVYESTKIKCPMVLGFFKPFVLIPQNLLKKLRDSEVRGVFLHELSHIYHRDHLTGVLQRITTILNWWNPLTYTLSANLSRAREEISDNHVLLRNDSKEYAECLVNLAERNSFFRRLPVSMAMASSHIPLTERVKHILSKERKMETQLKKSTIWVIVLVAFLFLGLIFGYRLTFATIKNETKPENAAVNLTPTKENPQENETQTEKEETAVRAVGDIKPPKLIKMVKPVYPELARKASIEGVVILELTTDIHGKVKKVKILRSIPTLDQAAIDAVKQWEYEPNKIDGKPRGIIFTVTCRFKFEDEKTKVFLKPPPPPPPAVRAVGDVKPPKLIKMVKPVYPELARKAGVEGTVILELMTDIHGKVKKVKILRSIPTLDQAAIDAVKQWEYEPNKIDGKPRGTIFTVTVVFELDIVFKLDR